MHPYQTREFPLSWLGHLKPADPLDVFAAGALDDDELRYRWKSGFVDRAKLETVLGAAYRRWYRIILSEDTPREARKTFARIETVIDEEGLVVAAEQWPMTILLGQKGYQYGHIPWLLAVASRLQLPEVPVLVALEGTRNTDDSIDRYFN